MGSYKHSNGHRVMRGSNGQFRKTTLSDMGIHDGNTEGIVFICNVCEKEFIPVLLSGKCCGVDNKREKEIVVTEGERVIMDKIKELKGSRFINRQILNQIIDLERELSAEKRKTN